MRPLPAHECQGQPTPNTLGSGLPCPRSDSTLEQVRIRLPEPGDGTPIAVNEELLHGVMEAYREQKIPAVGARHVYLSMLDNGCSWRNDDRAVKVALSRQLGKTYPSRKSAKGLLFSTTHNEEVAS